MTTWTSSGWEPFIRTAALFRWVALAAVHTLKSVSLMHGKTMPPSPRNPDGGMRERLRWRFGKFAPESLDLELAQAGDAQAQVRLALVYLNGYRMPWDPPAALAWLKLAAAQGNHDAYFELGRLYARGISVPKNPSEAIRWYRLAAASPNPGMVLPQFYLGCMHANGEGVIKNPEEAARWYLIAAERGHPRAMVFLALAYLHGDGVPQNSAAAHRWMHLSAEKGDSTAYFHLGHLYAQGRTVPRDPVAAIHWFRLAAEDKSEPLSVLPQYHLGRLYATGDCVPKDRAEAAKYYRIAAERGYPPAQCELGLSYLRGEGSAQDFVEALAWLTIAFDSSRRETYRQHQQALAAGLPPATLRQASARTRELSRLVYRNRRGTLIPTAWTETHAAPVSAAAPSP
jgi:TPR repeat protein